MILPPEPRSGQRLQASWGAAVVRYLRAIKLQQGVGYTINQTANGTLLQIPRTTQVGAVQTVDAPLTVNKAGTGKVRVVPGLVIPASGTALVPRIGGTGIDTLPAPELSITANGFVYLRVTTANDLATIADVLFAAAVPANTSTLGHLPIAQISNYSGGPPASFTISQSAGGSQQHQKCGGTSHLFGRV